MQGVAKTAIKHNGVLYEEGETIPDLSESEAEDALKYEAISLVADPFAAIIKPLGGGQ